MTPELGKLPGDDSARDAIHIAIAPAVAAEILTPGTHVGRTDSGTFAPVGRRNAVGIVDPFLEHPVPAGKRFWLCLFPGTVTGMRHEWQHPLFESAAAHEPTPAVADPSDPKAKARAVIQKAADFLGFSCERVLNAAEAYATSEADGWPDYEMDNTETYKSYEFGDEFWAAVVELTGCPMPKYKTAPYTCSC